MSRYTLALLFLLASATLTACSSPRSLYYWGSYEEQLYSDYMEPGKIPPEQQLLDLEKDLQLMQASNAHPHPGFHAHMGYLYFQIGKADRALQAFETEKKLFPESAVYMNRLIARLSH